MQIKICCWFHLKTFHLRHFWLIPLIRIRPKSKNRLAIESASGIVPVWNVEEPWVLRHLVRKGHVFGFCGHYCHFQWSQPKERLFNRRCVGPCQLSVKVRHHWLIKVNLEQHDFPQRQAKLGLRFIFFLKKEREKKKKNRGDGTGPDITQPFKSLISSQPPARKADRFRHKIELDSDDRAVNGPIWAAEVHSLLHLPWITNAEKLFPFFESLKKQYGRGLSVHRLVGGGAHWYSLQVGVSSTGCVRTVWVEPTHHKQTESYFTLSQAGKSSVTIFRRFIGLQ